MEIEAAALKQFAYIYIIHKKKHYDLWLHRKLSWFSAAGTTKIKICLFQAMCSQFVSFTYNMH